MYYIKKFDNMDEKIKDYAVLSLRIVLGIIFIYHGYPKLFGGLAGTAQFFASIGMPCASCFAVVFGLVEFFGGIALIIGFLTRWASLFLLIDMIVAFFSVHLKNGFSVQNGGIEFVLILIAGLITLKTLGAQKFSIDSALSNRF